MLIGGIASLLLGIYVIVIQTKIIRAGLQDRLGFDYKLLIAGVALLMTGGIMILQNSW
jgi:hypothetical protein